MDTRVAVSHRLLIVVPVLIIGGLLLLYRGLYPAVGRPLPDNGRDEHISDTALPLAPPLAQAQRDPWILISIPDRKLVVVRAGKAIDTYPIAVGKPPTPTPAGEFRVQSLDPHPRSSSGSLGARWIEFFRKTEGGKTQLYGIHGTNDPGAIGTDVSHGCIRLRNADVESVYRQAYLGEPVWIVDKPVSELLSASAAAPYSR